MPARSPPRGTRRTISPPSSTPPHPLPAGCDIQIVGVAPGASVLALKVFAQNDNTTTSGFLQAIDFAVSSGAKVINESFGSDDFPDTTLDVVRAADDAAVAAGVTVVVSSGDAGITSTIGSPASDPNVISVGATTTFRAYAQDTYGGINDPHRNGQFVDNNISALSSGGFTQAGNTIDLVAPGDLNWGLCSADTINYADCTNEQGQPSPIELSGGTSESAPLTAGAAADVIQAYASTHGGVDPSPALVKQILMSTATDLDAPAAEQGAGLLNVGAAVQEARSIAGTTLTPDGGLLIGPWPDQRGPAVARNIDPGDHAHQHRVELGSCRTLDARAHPPGRRPDRLVLHAAGHPDRLLSGEYGDVPDLERGERGVPGADLQRAAQRRPIPARVYGRLPGHRPEFPASFRGP